MALSTAQVTKVFKIFGIPERGAAYLAAPLIRGAYPAGTEYDVSEVKAKLNAILAALSATQESEVANLLTAWDTPGDSGVLDLHADGGAQGRIVDDEGARKLIRKTLSALLGFAVPEGGFAAEAGRFGRDYLLLK